MSLVSRLAPVCASLLFASLALAGCVDAPALDAEDQAVAGANEGAGGGGGGVVAQLPLVSVDPRRSLVVTEEAILARFPFQRVMDQLVAQSGVPGLTALTLFQQWWDTQNPGPGLGLGPHCDDVVGDGGQPLLDGFPYSCRGGVMEGRQAAVNPFVDAATNPDAYVPIGLFNRFDLAPSNGSNCGEYRIVYARRGGLTDGFDRNLIIFEAAIANPHPQQELKGCRRIVDFWAELTGIASLTERADRLERFYFQGLPGLIPPVVHLDHLGAGASGVGQIRTNQFMGQASASPRVWTLREFKLRKTCTGTTCTALKVVPVTVKGNPWGPLFDPTRTGTLADTFRAAFVAQVPALAAPTVSQIDLVLPGNVNAAESKSSGSAEDNYVTQFGTSLNPFRTAIADKLLAIGSALSPDDIVARAQALSCAGCHRLNTNLSLGAGLVLPSPLGFTHVSERVTEIVDGTSRFAISPALTDSFLPKRKQVMDDYLNERLQRPLDAMAPIGGRRIH